MLPSLERTRRQLPQLLLEAERLKNFVYTESLDTRFGQPCITQAVTIGSPLLTHHFFWQQLSENGLARDILTARGAT